ncbi:hypothetical protein FNH09_42435 [Streptomyces adustus]|uniref:Uncharacterized protein n=1 Tax=Streptomyces adustus TaxID=1609272 RepID=A0A5N8VQR8_9ACTN|nr:hypothetical protein [Streptomyces adustus]MPY37631.1 hypothetical protein [Streptomyces adustus]
MSMLRIVSAAGRLRAVEELTADDPGWAERQGERRAELPRVRNAMARIHGELANQNGEQVLSLELDAVVKNRPAARSDRAR